MSRRASNLTPFAVLAFPRWAAPAVLLSAVVTFLLFVVPVPVSAATIRLYLKDGTYQLVREYEVKPDRVRFFSTEREEWEEIPLEMIDLARTKKDIADHQEAVAKEDKEQAEEDNALREAEKEVQRVPAGLGVYYLRGDKIEPIAVAGSKIVTNKKRSVLKAITPVPMVASKETVELDGENAAVRVADTRPEFYFRLSNEERFGIVKLTKTDKKTRVVEIVEEVPVSKELVEKFDDIDTFKKQEGDLFFKIWPEKDLEPGEYALVEHTDGKINLQVWDFGVGEGTPKPPDSKKKRLLWPF
jgi:hypothetical protein